MGRPKVDPAWLLQQGDLFTPTSVLDEKPEPLDREDLWGLASTLSVKMIELALRDAESKDTDVIADTLQFVIGDGVSRLRLFVDVFAHNLECQAARRSLNDGAITDFGIEMAELFGDPVMSAEDLSDMLFDQIRRLVCLSVLRNAERRAREEGETSKWSLWLSGDPLGYGVIPGFKADDVRRHAGEMADMPARKRATC